MKKVIENIIAGTESLVAQEYLNQVVLNISSVINMEYVFVARTDLKSNISSTVATAINGVLSENFEYSLKDTPCDNVANNSICTYADNVAEIFSKDKDLTDMNIRGYIGSPLHDIKKNVIGIMVAFSKKPIDDSDFILTIMHFVSGRVAAELDRMDKELELQVLNETLEEKVKFATMDLNRAQSLAKIGSWRYLINEDILEWSDEIYNIFQIDKNKNQVNTLNDFFTRVDTSYIDIVKEAYNAHLKDAVPYNITNELVLEDGTSKWIKERCETSYDDNGNPMISHGVLQDVSEEIKINQHLIQQSRMAQMGEMISMIAHQWRQPLSAISASAISIQMKIELDQLKIEDNDKKNLLKIMKDIDKYTQNLSATIDDFRNFYKPNKKTDTIKLEVACRKSLSIIKTSFISNNIQVIEDYCSNDYLKVYTNEMVQVILNILKNAKDNFLEKDIKDPWIKISTNNRVLSICDNGGGIPDDVMDKIFDPYFSTKNEKNGTGLGLYMSKMIIEEHHNATLEVENTDNGVCFKIAFV